MTSAGEWAGRAGDDAHPFRADRRKFYRICFGTEAPTLGQRLRLFLTHLGFQCVMIYRLDRAAKQLAARSWAAVPLGKLTGILMQLVEIFHHVRVRAEVGPGFYIGHVGTIYIGPTRIGRNFSCTHNVTVGYGQGEGRRGYPVVGDDVWIGTGSVLAGAITVGEGATIAHGTMLTRSVPARVLVGGNPGKVLVRGYDNSRLMGQLVERAAPGPELSRELAGPGAAT